MHPDTELYLSELRNLLERERAAYEHGAAHSYPRDAGGQAVKVATGHELARARGARIVARLRSLRDWPQPGRPT